MSYQNVTSYSYLFCLILSSFPVAPHSRFHDDQDRYYERRKVLLFCKQHTVISDTQSLAEETHSWLSRIDSQTWKFPHSWVQLNQGMLSKGRRKNAVGMSVSPWLHDCMSGRNTTESRVGSLKEERRSTPGMSLSRNRLLTFGQHRKRHGLLIREKEDSCDISSQQSNVKQHHASVCSKSVCVYHFPFLLWHWFDCIITRPTWSLTLIFILVKRWEPSQEQSHMTQSMYHWTFHDDHNCLCLISTRWWCFLLWCLIKERWWLSCPDDHISCSLENQESQEEQPQSLSNKSCHLLQVSSHHYPLHH